MPYGQIPSSLAVTITENFDGKRRAADIGGVYQRPRVLTSTSLVVHVDGSHRLPRKQVRPISPKVVVNAVNPLV